MKTNCFREDDANHTFFTHPLFRISSISSISSKEDGADSETEGENDVPVSISKY